MTITRPPIPTNFASSAGFTSLGVEDGTIPDNQITASSYILDDPSIPWHIPSQARLNIITDIDNDPPLYVGGWCSVGLPPNQWIQVDFGASKVVSAIVLQGRQEDDIYVTKYKVQYSDGEDLWHFVTNAHDDTIKVRSLQNCP